MLTYTEPKKQIRYFTNQPNKSHSVGFCYNIVHKGAMSKKMMDNHQCLRKQCPFFKKNEEHPYWEQREKIKQLKKARRLATA